MYDAMFGPEFWTAVEMKAFGPSLGRFHHPYQQSNHLSIESMVHVTPIQVISEPKLRSLAKMTHKSVSHNFTEFTNGSTKEQRDVHPQMGQFHDVWPSVPADLAAPLVAPAPQSSCHAPASGRQPWKSETSDS